MLLCESSLKQLILSTTPITCSSSRIIDHILVGFPDRVTQQGILNVELSGHHLVYSARKIAIKIGFHKEVKFSSFKKNYTVDGY